MKIRNIFSKLIRINLAPLCPIPPDATEEGKKEHHPIPIPVDIEEECGLDSEEVSLTCPSFLNIYIQKVVYGRGPGVELCDGDKPADNSKPPGDKSCYDEDKDIEISNGLKTECHGKFTCSYTIPTLLLDVICDGMRREMRLQYICGKTSI